MHQCSSRKRDTRPVQLIRRIEVFRSFQQDARQGALTTSLANCSDPEFLESELRNVTSRPSAATTGCDRDLTRGEGESSET